MTLPIKPLISGLFLALLSAGCATVPPSGPGVMALPGTGKPFEQFRIDDSDCRSFASYQTINGPTATARRNSGESAVIGTLLGAATGAAFDGGQGAAIGAGTGLLLGTSVGAGNAAASSDEMQRRYDMAYIQCMYGKGNRVPVTGRMTGDVDTRSSQIPPPPAGAPPPPPPRR
ncbi:MAG: YMGG-like glycine zipper-containing protein [Pseudomonadota bacterium]